MSTAENQTGWRSTLARVPGQAWMALAAISFAVGNVYDQAATQNLNRPDAWVAASLQAMPVFLYGLIGFLFFVPKSAKSTTASRQPATLNGWALFAIAGVITQAGTAAFFQALIETKYQGLSITLPFVQTWELMAIFIAAIFLKEKPAWTVYVGMVIVVAGLAGITLFNATTPPLDAPNWWLAIPYGLAAAACWATSSILARSAMKQGVNPFGGLAVQYLFGGVSAFIMVLIQGNLAKFGLTPEVFWYVMGGAVINGILATGFLTFALRVAPAHKVLPINAVYPALSVLLGFLFLGNPVQILAFVCMLVVAGGLVFAQVGARLFGNPPTEVSTRETVTSQ
jgi:drug/metabolite transporter (DMT)-like permease